MQHNVEVAKARTLRPTTVKAEAKVLDHPVFLYNL